MPLPPELPPELPPGERCPGCRGQGREGVLGRRRPGWCLLLAGRVTWVKMAVLTTLAAIGPVPPAACEGGAVSTALVPVTDRQALGTHGCWEAELGFEYLLAPKILR